MQKIVLTGGSCGGKTEILKNLQNLFPEHLVVIPEAATLVFSSGPFSYKEMTIRQKWQFQKAVLLLQESMEQAFSFISDSPLLSLCDRGLLDGATYIPGGIEAFCQYFKLDKEQIFKRYAAIVHLESVATGTPEVYYKLRATNPYRYEILQEAQHHEHANRAVWQGHHNYHFVSCKNGLEGKIAYVKGLVEKFLVQ